MICMLGRMSGNQGVFKGNTPNYFFKRVFRFMFVDTIPGGGDTQQLLEKCIIFIAAKDSPLNILIQDYLGRKLLKASSTQKCVLV